MKATKKVEKALAFSALRTASLIRPKLSTQMAIALYKKWGMNIEGTPNYISSKVWFDGTDYSLITLGDGCTISSYVRFLTHDWSVNTILQKRIPEGHNGPVGRILPIVVGRHSFVGTQSTLLPGSEVGSFSIVGAGSMVRGKFNDYDILSGNPCKKVGDTREYLKKRFGLDIEAQRVREASPEL